MDEVFANVVVPLVMGGVMGYLISILDRSDAPTYLNIVFGIIGALAAHAVILMQPHPEMSIALLRLIEGMAAGALVVSARPFLR